ncbi:MAG TPA: 2-amino-4-hydroxy-6-hydroxymethyldihydropteridine diphosphokinase [Galbitalea sp.]|nr:2-amino-4-hydroxy-6-hydroxymethyldihydropteridine diphosphokinase [Galbitalea sp.]
MTRGTVAVLSLGSNLGDRERSLREALADIAALPGVTLLGTSGLVETAALKPAGVDNSAPAYLNAVAKVDTTLAPTELLARLNEIEASHGRVRKVQWGDRTLDIDIVTYGDLIQDDPRLTLPHPRAAERSFVLVPWLELDPGAELPGLGRIDGLPAAAADVSRYPAEALS